MAGFMGRGSEISWIRVVRAELGMEPDFTKLDAQSGGSGEPSGLAAENIDICKKILL